MKLRIAATVALVAVAYIAGYYTARTESRIRYSVQNQTVEIYVAGELAWEAQPSDGAIFDTLKDLLLRSNPALK